jgi:hypothetical protein
VVGLAIAKAIEKEEKRGGDAATTDEMRNLLRSRDGSTALSHALVQLAEQQLPAAMGEHYKSLVVKCLTCLEGGFGDIDFKTMEQEDACITLEAEIVAPLRRVNLGV